MDRKLFTILVSGTLLFLLSLFVDMIAQNIITVLTYPLLDIILGWFTSFMSVIVILLIVTTLFLIQEKKHEWIFPLWVTFSSAIIVSLALKTLITRPRPEELTVAFSALQYSFPSLHTMVAFSVVPLLVREFPKVKWFWILFACTVGFSRLYFDFHFLSDVVFGAFGGILIGYSVIRIEEHYRIFRFMQ